MLTASNISDIRAENSIGTILNISFAASTEEGLQSSDFVKPKVTANAMFDGKAAERHKRAVHPPSIASFVSI